MFDVGNYASRAGRLVRAAMHCVSPLRGVCKAFLGGAWCVISRSGLGSGISRRSQSTPWQITLTVRAGRLRESR